jgi:hypothetical protein
MLSMLKKTKTRIGELLGRLGSEAQGREIARLKRRLQQIERRQQNSGVRPENLVWVFGTARTGSTWLAAMMADLDGFAGWHEPLVGDVFGVPYYIRWPFLRDNDSFLLSDKYKHVWLPALRSMVLESAAARFGQKPFVVIQEPVGSLGAPLISRALPKSRIILLIRDPRDVAASLLAANRTGGWASEQKGNKGASLADTNPDRFVAERARDILRTVRHAIEAYDAHRGPKALLRYEDLRYDTLDQLSRVCEELSLPVAPECLRRVVKGHAWENVPKEAKGADKQHRKAKPGGWQEDFTAQQAETVARITAPILKRFYAENTPT